MIPFGYSFTLRLALKIGDNVKVINMYFNSEKSKIHFGRLLLIDYTCVTLATKRFTHNIET